MKTVKLTVAQALLRFLANQYVSLDGEERKFVHGMFAIFGHGNVLGLGEALENDNYGIETFRGNNEQAMAHSAIAFAKQQDRLGIIPATSSIGPGALNMVTAAGVATTNKIPLLLLPGDTFSDRQPDPVLQQVELPYNPLITANDAFKAVSVYWDRVYRPEMLMSALINAMRALTDTVNTGAVTLCLPQDVQCEVYDYPESFFEKRVWEIVRATPSSEALTEVASLIKAAKCPLIIAGGGVHYSKAAKALKMFCETHQIAMAETQAGKSAIPFVSSLNLGGIGVTGSNAANTLAREADLILAVGTKLSDFTTASKWQFANAKVVQLNVSRFDAYKMEAYPLISDAKVGLLELSLALSNFDTSHSYQKRIKALREEWDKTLANLYEVTNTKAPFNQCQALNVINQHVNPEDTVICAAGSLPGDLHRLWQSKRVKDYHLEYGFSCMGYEVAAGLGVALSNEVDGSSGRAYVLVGDGSFLMLHSELVSALAMGRAFTVVVFDNQGYQCIKQLQSANGSNGFATERLDKDANPLPIDFCQYASALGVSAFNAETLSDLEWLLADTRHAEKPVVISIQVDKKSMSSGFNSWWRADVAQASKSKLVNRARQKKTPYKETAREY